MKNIKTILNPAGYLVVVNKKQALPQNYIPVNLKTPELPFSSSHPPAKKLLRTKAAVALAKMQHAAARNNLQLIGVSGYRSYYRQQQIYQAQIRTKGKKAANKISAPPGHSEHQTGLAIDLSCPRLNYKLITEFAATKEGNWLAENSFKFGFILRYPEDKQKITGYQYEPWHFRYVTSRHARVIFYNQLTLEEYCEQMKNKN